MKKTRFKIYYLFYLIPVAVLAYLFWQNIRPVLEVKCDVGEKTRLWPVRGDIFNASNGLCGELVPTARVATAKDGLSSEASAKDGAVIKEEPVYFDVRLPRKYDRVEAEIEYSNLKTDIFEFGVARDEAKKNFDFAPLENKILDNLGWKKIEQDGLVLYQRRPVYKSISNFLMDPGNFKETLVYRADLAPKIENLSAKGKTVIDFPVKEKIKLMVYSKSGEPDIKVDAAGDYKINVADAGNFKKVDIVGGTDTIFNKISINSPYVAILDGIKIGKLDHKLKIYFAGSRLLANAHAAGGAQTIDANGQILNIKRIQEQYVSVFKNIKLRLVEIPKGEVELGAVLFFVNDKNIFYPRYEAFYGGADLANINFILARYASPQAGDIKIVSPVFDIADTPTPNRKIRFLFSLPNAAKGELVKIKSIELKFTGEKFGIKKIFQKIFNNVTI